VLSVKKVARLKTRGRYYDAGNGGVRGLCLQVSASGAKSWLLRYQKNGRKGWMGLGSASEVSLKRAREQALEAREKLRNNVDPVQLRRAERSKQAQALARALTFREAAQRYWDANSSGWSNRKHAQQFLTTLRQHVFPIIGNHDVATIDTPDVLRVLEQKVPVHRGWPAGRFWDVRAKTADRVRRRIGLILDFAVVRGFRPSGLPNPARWKGHIDQVLPAPSDVRKTDHHRALAYARVPELMAKLAGHQGIAARALAFVTFVDGGAIGRGVGRTLE
jgi:Phage integrase central domain/Arm DNA-binding domain